MTERKTFQGGMNSDDVVDMVPDGDYLVAYNCRPTKDVSGGSMAMKPDRSTAIRTTDPLSGDKTVIGSYTDEPNQRVFHIKHHSGGNHRIWCWNRRTNQNLIVVQDANVTGGLGFNLQYQVHSMAMIGPYLYWTDNLNQPRRIDVERALRANNPSYTSPDGTAPVPYQFPLEQWDITVARRSPVYAPLTRKLISADEPGIPDRQTNLIQFLSFQFSVRFSYSTGEYSTLGPYSQVQPQNISRYPYFNGYTDERAYDTIRVELDKNESIDPEVSKVEFLVRRGNGAWHIFKTFDRRTDLALFNGHNTYGGDALGEYFYNDLIGIPVADQEAYLQFFDVPIKSASLEIAANRVWTLNNVKGYDYVNNLGITLSRRVTGAANPDLWLVTAAYYLIEWQCGTGISEKVVMRVRDAFGAFAGWYETPYTAAQFNSNSLDLNPAAGSYTRYPIIDPNDIPTALIAYLNPTCQDWTFTPYTNGPDNVVIDTDWEHFINATRAFREGHTYRVHVVFYDFAGRNPGICHTPEEVAIPGPKYLQDGFTIGIDWSLDNLPGNIPEWAHSYAIARSRAMERFIAGYADIVRYGDRQADGSYDLTNTTYSAAYEVVGVDFEKMVSLGFGYQFLDGDVMLLIKPSQEKFYLDVVGVQGNFILTEPADLGNLSGANFYFELKTPKEDETGYWEVGRNYAITDPGTPTRSFSVESGTLYGDTYFGKRQVVNTEQPVQCMCPNNKKWQEWPQDTGRASQLVYSKQRRYITDLHPSGQYFPGTETNALNAFLAGENRVLDEGLGAGQRLLFTSRTQEYGTVLLAICSEETASIYIQRSETYNSDESSNLIRVQDLVGTVNVLRGGYGTLNPESVVEANGRAYWFSALKSAFVRYSLDGITAVSDMKLSAFAAWLGQQVLTAAADVPGVSQIRVPAGVDIFKKEVLWSVPPIGTWPIQYLVLDATEQVTMSQSSPGVWSGTLLAGELHRVTITFNGPLPSSTKVQDYFFGERTFSTGAATVSFIWSQRPGAPQQVVVTSTPDISTVPHTVTVERLRQDPYAHANKVPRTLVFSEERGRFSFFSPMTPEWFGRVGDQLISYRSGILHTHDSAAIGSFYGVQYPAWLSVAFNSMPNSVKRLEGTSMESSARPNYAHFRTEEPYVQSTDITTLEFSEREGIYSAGIRRDRLSPNTPGTVFDKLLRGDLVKGRYTKALFEWAKGINFATRIVNLNTRPSTGHKT